MSVRRFVLGCVPIVLFFVLYHHGNSVMEDDAVNDRDVKSPIMDWNPSHTEDTRPTRICQPEERKQALQDYCRKHSHALNKNHFQLRQRVNRMIVDDIHKVLFCLHAKVGCTTWKTILANNTSYYPISADRLIGIHSEMLNFNLSFLHENKFSDEEIQYRLNNYYKVMVVRHPHDRLNSFFQEKFVHGNGVYNRSMGLKIMNAYHSDLPREIRRDGNVSFSDVTRWIQDEREQPDSHYDGPYLKKCDPCFVKYDYIVKLESQKTDADYIVRNKLQGRGVGTWKNVKAEKKEAVVNPLLTSGKTLEIFKNLTDEQMQFMHDRLRPDLDMFGYSFDEIKLQAKCGYKDKDCC